MKKLLMSLAIFGACALMSASATDSYLYWMVDQGDNPEFSFTTAVLKGSNGSESFAFATLGEGETEGYLTGMSVANVGTIADPATFSFVVELYAADGWLKAKSSEPLFAKDAVGLYQSLAPGGTPASKQMFTSFTAQAIPEPTSGMMVLLGAMLLGLKRKKA